MVTATKAGCPYTSSGSVTLRIQGSCYIVAPTNTPFVNACDEQTFPSRTVLLNGSTDASTGKGFFDIVAPFPLALYDTMSPKANIGVNGAMTINSLDLAGFFIQCPLQQDFTPRSLVAPFWVDISIRPDGALCWAARGTPGNEEVVVTWSLAKLWDNPINPDNDNALSFSVIFSSASRDLVFVYGTFVKVTSQGASIGLLNADGTKSTEWTCGDTVKSPPATNTVLTFTWVPPGPQTSAPRLG
jgi:hypothetical protein